MAAETLTSAEVQAVIDQTWRMSEPIRFAKHLPFVNGSRPLWYAELIDAVESEVAEISGEEDG